MQKLAPNSPETLLADRDLPYADFIALDNPPRLLVVAAAEIRPAGACSVEMVGRVIVARELNAGGRSADHKHAA